MTNPSPNPPPEPPSRRNPRFSLLQWIRNPYVLVAGATLVSLGIASYVGVRGVVYQRLSPRLEQELSKTLQRPVKLGEIESFSLHQIRFGASSIPATASDPDNLDVKAIAIGFNPLPLLLGQPLALDITLVDPNLYLEQDKTGKWINLDLPQQAGRRLPIAIAANIRLEDGDIALLPYGGKSPLTIQVDGKGRYVRGDVQEVGYDLDAIILNSEISIEGETTLETGASQVALTVEKLALPELVALAPNFFAQVNQGKIQTNLSFNLPSWEEINATRGQGNLNLKGLEANIKPLRDPLKISANLNLEGQKVLIEKAQVSLSTLVAQVSGEVDWQKGYDLAITVESFRVSPFLYSLFGALQTKIDGGLQGKFQMQGALAKPRITGFINNTQPVIVDKILFKDLRTNVDTDLNTLLFPNLQATPSAGGKILGKGTIKINLLKSLAAKKAIDGTKMPLAATFKAEVPPREVIAPYYRLPTAIAIKTLNAQGEVGGTLAKPQISFKWQSPFNVIPTATTASLKGVGRGQVFLGGPTILLRNTILETEQGKLFLNGEVNSQTKQWQSNLTTTFFALTPFLASICQDQRFSCPPGLAAQAVALENTNIRLAGKLDAPNLQGLQGIGTLGLRVGKGRVAVNSRLSQGSLNTSVLISQLSLTPFLPQPATLERGNIQISSRLGNFDLKTIAGIANLGLRIDGGTVAVNSRFSQGRISGNAVASQVSLNRLLAQPATLETGDVQFSSPLNTFNLQKVESVANLGLRVDGGKVAINGRLSQGNIDASAVASQIALNRFLPNLNAPVSLGRSQVNLTGRVERLFKGSRLNFDNLSGNADLQLLVADSPVNAKATLSNGSLQAVVNGGRLSLNDLLPNLPIAANVTKIQVNLSGKLSPLIASLGSKQPDLNSFSATADTQLAVANGTVKALTQLNRDRWQSQITASNLNTTLLLSQLAPQKPLVNLPNLNAKVSLAGSLANLFNPQASLPVQATSIAIVMGEQRLNGNGTISLSSLTKSPDIQQLNLNLQASSNLGQLPLKEFLAFIPLNARYRPQMLQVAGKADFQGRLVGKNLISAPNAPGSLQWSGKLQLANFSFNNRVFEPLLTGFLKGGIGQTIALNLRGQEDVIAASLSPCNRSQCLVPYLPDSFELRQIAASSSPIIAQGKRQGDRLIAQLESFPLELLQISPASAQGISGILEGIVSANLDIDLFSLKTQGNINLAQGGVGMLKTIGVNANFIYDNQLARLSNATIQLGNSLYQIDGSINLASGAIQGNLMIEQGEVQDLLATLKIYDVDSLIRFLEFQPRDYADGEEVKPNPVGDADAPLSAQVNLLAEIDRQIREFAARIEAGRIPQELDIRGKFQAAIAVRGTLNNPQVDFQLQGKQWQWHPEQAFPNIVPPLGLVIVDSQVIPISEARLQGRLSDGVVQIQTARLALQDTVFSLTGDLAPKQANATFEVENLSLDILRNFAQIPDDVNGNFNLRGSLAGSLFAPKVQGEFSFVEGTINARGIDTPIVGNFNYSDAQLQVRTTNPSYLQAYASIPYPPKPGVSDRFVVNFKLGTKAIALINLFTQDQFNWIGGEGEVIFAGGGRIDTSDGVRFYDLTANGKILLRDAILQSAAFPEALTVNGDITLDNQRLKIEQLQGTVADSRLTAIGVLPIFIPLDNNDSDRATPLTITIEKGQINLPNLYTGGIDGQVLVTGTALSPVIGGEVRLANGQVFIPEGKIASLQVTPILSKLNKPRQQNPVITPKLADFRVILQDLVLEQLPLYRFNFGGELALNGPLNNLNNLKPAGVIQVDRGIFNFFDTRFVLNRRNNNQIVFTPTQGLLNPNLNIQMRTLVSEVAQSKQFRSDQSNEIPDNSLNQVRRIDINLSLNGQVSQLLPNLGKDTTEACRIYSDPSIISGYKAFSQAQLQRLTTCLTILAAQGKGNEQLLSNSIIKLTSSPPRSQGEIIRLLGNQLFIIAEALQGQNTEQLLQYGIVQLALPMISQGIVYDIENSISKTINSTDFRIAPFLETVYRVDKEGYVRLSYDYNFNEVRVQYETRF